MNYEELNEKTSERVAKIAGRVLVWCERAELIAGKGSAAHAVFANSDTSEIVTVLDLKTLAASCLTQTKDKPKGKR